MIFPYIFKVYFLFFIMNEIFILHFWKFLCSWIFMFSIIELNLCYICDKNAYFLHDCLEDFLVVATVVCPATGEARPVVEAAATLQLQVGVATL